jgi:hypothetical protein
MTYSLYFRYGKLPGPGLFAVPKSYREARLDLNGRACFKKRKQLFQYQHLLLETSVGQSSNSYLNVVHFLNTRDD